MKLLALALLLAPFTSLASVESCEAYRAGPLTPDSVPVRKCGLVEAKAAVEAFKAGLQKDIDQVIAGEIAGGVVNGQSFTSCKQSPTQAVRVQVEAGNHGKDVSVLLLTEVKCESKYFVSSPLHQFPILVKLWSSHDESLVDLNSGGDIELKKLYK